MEITKGALHDSHGEQQHHDAPLVKGFLAPSEIYEHVIETGVNRPRMSFLSQSVLAVLAGGYLGFGFVTCMLAGGQLSKDLRMSEPGLFNFLFGAFGFPLGLSMIVIAGGNLVTGNMSYMVAAGMVRKVTIKQIAGVLLLSYFMNLAGCLLVGQMIISGQVFLHREAFTIELALKKCSYPFVATMTKGIMCNWLVNMAIWQATAAQDITGKLLGVWFPISAFVTMGMEHCVANMFLIPLAMRLGAPISVKMFLTQNLIPVTLGNFIGGAGFVAVAMGLAYGQVGEEICQKTTNIINRIHPQRRLADEPTMESIKDPDAIIDLGAADASSFWNKNRAPLVAAGIRQAASGTHGV